MAPVTPTKEPTSFTAGDTVEYETSPADYPPSEGWTGAAYIVLSGSIVTATVTDDDAGTFTVSFAAVDFASIVTETEARLVFRVTGSGDYDGDIKTVYDAPVTILPNVTGATLDSSRSDAEIELDAVKAAILALTTTPIASYSIGGRSVTKHEIKTLYARQAILESRIRAEKGYGFRKRLVAFG